MTLAPSSPTAPAPPDVDASAYLDGVREVLPRIRARSAEAEALGTIPAGSVADLERCGLFLAVQPRRWGGLELDPATFFRSVVLVASACGAHGWVAGVLGVHPWELACMDPQSQSDVWGTDHHMRAASSYAPAGSAEPVVDGYLVRGVWRFSSGIDHAGWVLLGAVVAGEEDLGVRVFLVDRASFTVDDQSWQVAGLGGTGSKDVHVAGAVVPAHRTHLMADLSRQSWPRPGWELNPGPLYRLPWLNLFCWAIASPALGAATGLVEEYVAQAATRVSAFGGPPVWQSPSVQQRIAEASARLDGLERSMVMGWDELWAQAAGAGVDPLSAARSRYAGAHTIAESVDAAMTVFAQAGGGAMALTNPLQRYLRDLLAMRNHPMGALDRFAAEQARAQFGSPAAPPKPPQSRA